MRVLLVLLLLGVSHSFGAQAIRAPIAAGVACVDCKIQLVSIGHLGDDSGPGSIEHIETRATRNTRGQYITKSNYPSTLTVYDSSRRFVRTIGRKGSGPGEFEGIGAAVFGVGDSLHVFDQVLHRFSVLDPAYKFVSSGPLPLGPELSALVMPNGEYVFALPLSTAAQRAQPLHRVNRTGKLARSFGSQSGEFRSDIPFFDRRAIAVAKGGMVWSAFRTQYVIERWNTQTGLRDKQIGSKAAWFPSRLTPATIKRNEPDAPQPFIMAVRESAGSILWVLIAVPDPKWRSAASPRRSADDHVQIEDEQLYYDTVIEALDASTGRLLASVRVPQFIRQFVADDEVGSVMEDGDGMPRLHLWRLALASR